MSEQALSAASTMLAGDAATGTEQQEAANNEAANQQQQNNSDQNQQQDQNNQGQDAPKVDAVTMPGKDATPEQWAEFYAKLRPETAEAYELPVPEGDDGAFAKEASTWMHEAGLSKEQAGKLAAKWNEMTAKQQQAAMDAEAAEAQAQHAKNTAEQGELQKEWGQNFDANMHQAKMAVQQFLPKDQAGDIIGAIESKVGYKATIQFLQNIGARLGEHDAAGLGHNNAGETKRSLEDRLYGGTAKH